MILEFSVNKPQDWLRGIAEKLGVEPVNDVVDFPAHIGEGFIRHYYLSNGLTLNYLRLKSSTDITFSRKAGTKVPYTPVIFYINEEKMEQDIENDIKYISSFLPNGIFWPSEHISSKWRFPVNKWVSNITLTLNHDWLLNNFGHDEKNYVYQILSSEKPFYVFEEITPGMIIIINELIGVIDSGLNTIVSRLLIECKTTELLALYFQKLINRPLSTGIASLNSMDVEKLFHVKEILLKNTARIPKINDLAREVGFSESKLQKKFKQVFGKSIFQYALHERMIVARKMLETKKYTVSEVGYYLGYSNLSQFTRAFNKQFGINPKKFITRKL